MRNQSHVDTPFISWLWRGRRSSRSFGLEGGFEEALGRLGGEPFDDGDVLPSAFDGVEDPVVRATDRVGEGVGGRDAFAHLGRLEPGVLAGEFAGVVLGIPGGEPDEGELAVLALEDGETVAVPAGGRPLAAVASEQDGQSASRP